MKALVAYYSRRGENMVAGMVRDLPLGNTEILAALLQKMTGAEMFHIEPAEDYSEDYYRCIDEARQDLQKGYRPPLKRYLEQIEEYNVIYLGYPNYWGTMPMPVFSFLERYDFSGKIIKPFCTHEGGGLGRSERELKRACPGAEIQKGLAVRGADIKAGLSVLEEWIWEEAKNPAEAVEFTFKKEKEIRRSCI